MLASIGLGLGGAICVIGAAGLTGFALGKLIKRVSGRDQIHKTVASYKGYEVQEEYRRGQRKKAIRNVSAGISVYGFMTSLMTFNAGIDTMKIPVRTFGQSAGRHGLMFFFTTTSLLSAYMCVDHLCAARVMHARICEARERKSPRSDTQLLRCPIPQGKSRCPKGQCICRLIKPPTAVGEPAAITATALAVPAVSVPLSGAVPIV